MRQCNGSLFLRPLNPCRCEGIAHALQGSSDMDPNTTIISIDGFLLSAACLRFHRFPSVSAFSSPLQENDHVVRPHSSSKFSVTFPFRLAGCPTCLEPSTFVRKLIFARRCLPLQMTELDALARGSPGPLEPEEIDEYHEGGPGAGVALTALPIGRETTTPSHLFRVILLRRLRQPFSLPKCLIDPQWPSSRSMCSYRGARSQRFCVGKCHCQNLQRGRWPSSCVGHGPPHSNTGDARRLEVVVGLPTAWRCSQEAQGTKLPRVPWSEVPLVFTRDKQLHH